MKKGLAVLLVFLMMYVLCVPAFAVQDGVTYYIDSINGSDSADGLSPQTAWRTIPVKTATLSKGDRVLFRRGGTYACTLTLENCVGTPQAPILVSAYGEGGKPLLYTEENTEVLRLFDCSYLTVSDLEITAHNGGGIWIDALQGTCRAITLANLEMHDIQNYKVTNRDALSNGAATARACVMIKGLPAKTRYAVHDLTITGCSFYDCGNGVSDWGSWNDSQEPWAKDVPPDPIYNENHRIENCDFHDMDAEAVIFGICQNSVMTHCRCIDCCQGEGVDADGNILYYTAAAWFWGADHCTIEYCEIAGQKNVGDGMTVDFDSQSNYCTYQYIYSHDNVRFVCNNSKTEPQVGNVVRYCLSVNDDKGNNVIAAYHGEKNLQFYNNTIIHSQEIRLDHMFDCTFANNLIVMKDGYTLQSNLRNFLLRGNTIRNNCFVNIALPLWAGARFTETPGFSGTDLTDPLSFRLSAQSPLIGAGIPIAADSAEDFFGDAVASRNIGCYGGTGTDTPFVRDSLAQRIAAFFRNIFKAIPHNWGVRIAK